MGNRLEPRSKEWMRKIASYPRIRKPRVILKITMNDVLSELGISSRYLKRICRKLNIELHPITLFKLFQVMTYLNSIPRRGKNRDRFSPVTKEKTSA